MPIREDRARQFMNTNTGGQGAAVFENQYGRTGRGSFWLLLLAKVVFYSRNGLSVKGK